MCKVEVNRIRHAQFKSFKNKYYEFDLYADSIDIIALPDDPLNNSCYAYTFFIKNDKIDWSSQDNAVSLYSNDVIDFAEKWLRKTKLSAFE